MRERRLENDRIRHALTISLESETEYGHRLELDRIRHAYQRENESQNQHENHLRTDRETRTTIRNIETETERQQRLRQNQMRRINRQSLLWRNTINSGFNYDPNINYSSKAEIGSMNIVCSKMEIYICIRKIK